MSTPHINASENAFAETVLMAGDPLRIKFIADNFLEKVEQVTNVRSMLGYTGYYKDHKVSLMGHGMGIPSCSIYVTELIRFYNVKNIIRVGSCGGVMPDVKLGDIVIAMGASTNSNVNRIRFNNYDLAAIADYKILQTAVNMANKLELSIKVGNIFSEDLFYSADNNSIELFEKYNILAVEMEAAGIYSIAAELKARALAICTVSDHIKTGESMDSEKRQTGFKEMMQLGLETAINL